MAKMGPKSLIFGCSDVSVQACWYPDALKVLAPLEAAAKPLASGRYCRASKCQNFIADIPSIIYIVLLRQLLEILYECNPFITIY